MGIFKNMYGVIIILLLLLGEHKHNYTLSLSSQKLKKRQKIKLLNNILLVPAEFIKVDVSSNDVAHLRSINYIKIFACTHNKHLQRLIGIYSLLKIRTQDFYDSFMHRKPTHKSSNICVL